MEIGNFGSVYFEVSPEVIKTLRDLSRQGSADIQSHKRHLNVDLPEYVGRGLDTTSFNIRLSKYLGASDPKSDEKTLINYCRNGSAQSLILGGERFGDYKWLISKYKSTYEHHDASGGIVTIDMSITLTEYPKE